MYSRTYINIHTQTLPLFGFKVIEHRYNIMIPTVIKE